MSHWSAMGALDLDPWSGTFSLDHHIQNLRFPQLMGRGGGAVATVGDQPPPLVVRNLAQEGVADLETQTHGGAAILDAAR